MNEPEQTDSQKSQHSHAASGPAVELGPAGSALDGSGQPATTSALPSDDPQAGGSLQDVLQELTSRPSRDPVTNRFTTSSIAAGKTLRRSEQFWNAVEHLKRDLVERVRTDLAADDSTAETLLGLIDGYAEARLFRSSMFLRLVDQGGPITNKGKARALYRAYLDALDRETKLAQVLGLERKTKPVNPLDAVRSAVVEAQDK